LFVFEKQKKTNNGKPKEGSHGVTEAVRVPLAFVRRASTVFHEPLFIMVKARPEVAEALKSP